MCVSTAGRVNHLSHRSFPLQAATASLKPMPAISARRRLRPRVPVEPLVPLRWGTNTLHNKAVTLVACRACLQFVARVRPGRGPFLRGQERCCSSRRGSGRSKRPPPFPQRTLLGVRAPWSYWPLPTARVSAGQSPTYWRKRVVPLRRLKLRLRSCPTWREAKASSVSTSLSEASSPEPPLSSLPRCEPGKGQLPSQQGADRHGHHNR